MNRFHCAVILLHLNTVLKCVVCGTETASPEKYLLPRNFNPHPYQKPGEDIDEDETSNKYIQRIIARHNQVFGRKGPVMFPDDGLPPPRNPLIVTARPLLEEIAKSDQAGAILSRKPSTAIQNIQRISDEDYSNTVLNNAGVNDANNNNYYHNANLNAFPYQNNVAQQTYNGYLNQIFGNKPSSPALNKYVGDVAEPNPTQNTVLDYQGGLYNGFIVPSNGLVNNEQVPYVRNHTFLQRLPYVELLRKLQILRNDANPVYDPIQEQAVIPATPALYGGLGRYATSKVLDNIRKPKLNPAWKEHETNTVENTPEEDDDDDEGDYYNDNTENEEKQYAFSYSVKDHETGDDFSHSQQHVGSATKGEYRVKLPDGRMQIVSYTADNGGYKADVRYEEDSDTLAQKKDNQEISYPQHSRVSQNVVSDYSRKYLPNKSVTLGRIVVPSQEDIDYQDVDYNNNYNDVSSTNAPYIYVTDPVKEVLITSKPGYLYTPAPTQSNLLYNQYLQQNRYVTNVTPTAKAYLYGATNTYSPLAEGSDQHNVYSTTTNDPQEASKTYSHYYNAESVKFVSTTPNYRNYRRQPTFFKSTTKIPPRARNDVHTSDNEVLTTPEPETNKYDHLDSPDVVKIEPRPKTTVRYTTLAPLLFNSILTDSITSTTSRPIDIDKIVRSTKSPINIKESVKGAGNFGGVDIRKYFTFTKR